MGWWLDWRLAPTALLLVSFGLIIMAIVGPLKVTDQINKTLEEEFLFTQEGQPGWNRFVNNTQADSASSYLKLWLINTTNWEDAQMGASPILNEVGPYVFRQYIVNAKPTFSYAMQNYTFSQYPDGLSERVITFVPWIYVIWDEGNPLNENRTLNDVFTVPNYGIWALYNSPFIQPNLKPVLLSLIVNGFLPDLPPSTPFQKRTANDLLFGYVDPLLDLLYNMTLAPTNKVTFIRNQTDAADAESQVNTTTLSCGFPNTIRFQQFILWQNKSNINYWKGGLAPAGTPGNYFGFSERGKAQNVQLFWAQISRYLGLHSTGESSVKGVKTFRYVFDESEVYNASKNAKNDKYYQYGPNGLFNATTVNTAAIYYSWPHFYLGDDSLRAFINASSNYPAPTKANDESWIEVQQVIGLSVKGRRLLQGNMVVGGIDQTQWNFSMPDINFWPTYWMSLESEMTDAQADQMRDALDFYDRAQSATKAMLYGGCIGAAVAFLASIFLFYKRREMWKRGSTVGLLAEEQQTEDVPIGYVESGETPASPGYGART